MSWSARTRGTLWTSPKRSIVRYPWKRAGVRQQFWLVDGKVRGFRFAALSDELMAKRQQQVGRKFAEQRESRELANVDLRLEHMDQTGVDIQVLHNTMFIESCTDRPAVD